jgi:hypothetical protein
LKRTGNFAGGFGVLYGRSGGSAEDEGDTMSQGQGFVVQVSLAIAALLSPTLLMAQRGPAGMGGAHMAPMAAPQAMHAPSHVAQAPHSTLAHSVSTGSRPNAPRIAAHPAGSKPSVRTYPSRPNSTYNSNYNSSYSYDDYPAPGLGFDYVHYAAVHPNARHDHFRGGGIVPFYGGGYYFPEGGYYAESGTPDQSAAIDQNEQSVPSSDVAESEAPQDQVPSVPYARSKPTPVPPSPEYIFVRRDGSVFFAVAYSWVNGNLQYVTQDGFRRLTSTSTLDLDATTQFNEQRGVVFHSPA